MTDRRPYTPADDAAIRILLERGLSQGQIAEQLGRTRLSVRCQIRRLRDEKSLPRASRNIERRTVPTDTDCVTPEIAKAGGALTPNRPSNHSEGTHPSCG